MNKGSRVEVVGVSAQIRDLFCSDANPRERLEQAHQVFYSPDGLVAQWEGSLSRRDEFGFPVQRVVRLDGYEVHSMQQGWGLFNPTRKVELTRWAYQQFDAHNVVDLLIERIRETSCLLEEAPPSVVLGLLPADPANYNLMVHCGGLSACGEVAGWLLLEVWPSAGNLSRLCSVVDRCLLLGQSWARGRPTTVADSLELEGSVAASVEELGGLPEWLVETPWATVIAAPPDHRQVLDVVAQHSGCSVYEEMKTNLYGNVLGVESFEGAAASPQLELPKVSVLDPDDLAYSAEVLSDLSDAALPVQIAGALYGDAALHRYGHRTLGLSAWAGLELGYRNFRSG